MRRLSYQVIPYGGGWTIALAEHERGSFASQVEAFDAAVRIARTLRQAGFPVTLRFSAPESLSDTTVIPLPLKRGTEQGSPAVGRRHFWSSTRDRAE